MKYYYTGFTDQGSVREINQDALFMRLKDDMGLFCVADGMGGHQDGEKASKMIVQCLFDWWEGLNPISYNNDFQKMVLNLCNAVEKANRLIKESTAPGAVSGSTVVILFLYKNYYCTISAGDSRIYMRRKHKFSLITVDETWENMLDNTLSESEKKRNSLYGKLVNAIGVNDRARISVKTDVLQQNDLFVLCCDGIYKYCADSFLKKILKRANSSNIADCSEKIKNEIFLNGAPDNLTMIVAGTEA